MEIPRHWRLKKQRYGLIGDVCNEDHPAFPPDDVCKDCDPEKARADAIAQSVAKTERGLIDIKRQIVIYEAHPDLYETLDEIKLS